MPLGEAAALCSTVCLPFAHQARDLAVSRGPGCTKAKVHTSLEMSWDLYMFSTGLISISTKMEKKNIIFCRYYAKRLVFE